MDLKVGDTVLILESNLDGFVSVSPIEVFHKGSLSNERCLDCPAQLPIVAVVVNTHLGRESSLIDVKFMCGCESDRRYEPHELVKITDEHSVELCRELWT